jgi:ribosomal protein L11 methyltransferase
MAWFRLRCQLAESLAPAAEALLEDLGAVAVTLMDAGDTPILEPDPGATPRWQQCRVEALFSLPADFEAIRHRVIAAGFQPDDLQADFLEDDDWLNRWRQYAVEYCFADRLWIAPKDAPLPEGAQERFVLRLDPGLAFGSGSHPTTRLCMEWLAQELPEPNGSQELRLLDFGCGSGVLALAALMLGATDVIAIDHDPQALLATADNAAYNALADSRLRIGDADILTGEAPFDVIVANILAAPLIELAPRIVGLLRPGGRLVLSGILEDQAAAVAAAYPELAFQASALQADDQGGHWARLVARKPDR